MKHEKRTGSATRTPQRSGGAQRTGTGGQDRSPQARQSSRGMRPDDFNPPSDLERNPGIGASKGAFASGEDPASIEGESTFEGDVENETTRAGGVSPRHLGRTNK